MTTFTRKHFEATAEILAQINSKADRKAQALAWCSVFQKANKAFQSSLFLVHIEKSRNKALAYKGQEVAKEYLQAY